MSALCLRRCCLIALVGLGVWAPSAFAHAAFEGSSPQPGASAGRSPREIRVEFTEALNQRLSRLAVVPLHGGRRVPGANVAPAANALAFRPARALPKGGFRVEWHTVSTLDGHSLDGSFNFGVSVGVAAGEREAQLGPLARGGWLRALLRTAFYAALFFFAGGALAGQVLSRGRQPAEWLAPDELEPQLGRAGLRGAEIRRRAWRRTLIAGRLAALLAVAVTLAETAQAGGGLSAGTLSAFLFSNVSGVARVAVPVVLATGVLLARRRAWPAAVGAAAAMVALAFSGHAHSAHPAGVAVATDVVHLLAAAAWVGGIAQLASLWLADGRLRDRGLRGHRALRRGVLEWVLPRFGRLALPAFAVVVATGVVNALIQLGGVSALWRDSYGLVLLAKMTLVAAIALASYLHALRIRPRLLAANPHPPVTLERRHWQLLRAEPLVGVGVLAAAALLVSFPLPPRQLIERAERPAAACARCVTPRPTPRELAVADGAGSAIVAAWVRPGAGGLRGTVRALSSNFQALDEPLAVPGAATRSCGPGCLSVRVSGRPATLVAQVRERGRWYATALPVRWLPEASARAARLVVRGEAAMKRLRSVRIDETLSGGPGQFLATRYRLQAPDRFAFAISNGAEAVIVGRYEWTRLKRSRWARQSYAGGPAFQAMSYFGWWNPYAGDARLLDVGRVAGRRVADVAMMSHANSLVTWLRLRIDLATMRVLRLHMTTAGHFMRQRYFDFDRPIHIDAPSR